MATNIFATILTYAAPSANYRGESEANRTVIQRISKNGKEYAVISPESMRNALREIIASKGLDCNRRRLHDEEQLAVEFKDYPNPEKFADDFLFGYMVAAKEDVKEMKKRGHSPKRDSLVRMNLAVATTPYRFDATFHQSPLNAGGSPWKNAAQSALLHKEVSHTAFQFPFALSCDECLKNPHGARWLDSLLEAIGELNEVAGGHARSYFEMAPRSIVLRKTPSLVAGFNTYGFDENGNFTEIDRISADDLPPKEFWLGGDFVRQMESDRREKLSAAGAHLFENPQQLLKAVAEACTGVGATR
jgi:CRISPR-associated protein Cst2